MFGRKRIRELEHQTKVLIGTLAWYADDHNWRRKHVNPKGQPRQWEKSLATTDRGARAREVMERIESGQLPATWVDRLLDGIFGPEDQLVPWRARPARPTRASYAPPAITPMSGRVDDLQWPHSVRELGADATPLERCRMAAAPRPLATEDTE